MNDRGVSELVGFILIFGIIFTGATVALSVGESGLDQIRTFEQKENAERAFVLLDQSFEELTHSRAVIASGSIDLNDGRISHEDGSVVTVTVTNAGGGTFTRTLDLGALAYRIDDTTVRYESGMVTRTRRANTVRVSEPHLRCNQTAERAFLSVVTLKGDDSPQIGGGVVQVSAQLNETNLVYPRNRTGAWNATDATEVEIDVTSPREEAWNEYLSEEGWTDTDGGYTCNVDSGGLYVRQTVADVSFKN